MAKQIFHILAFLLLLINGTGAIYGGWSLITDPSGKDLQMPIEWLRYTPFNDYFIPGIILFLVNGVLSFVVMLLMIGKVKKYFLFVSMEGVLLTGWIVVQLLMTRMFHPFQLILGIAGILLIIFGWQLKKINTLRNPQPNNNFVYH